MEPISVVKLLGGSGSQVGTSSSIELNGLAPQNAVVGFSGPLSGNGTLNYVCFG